MSTPPKRGRPPLPVSKARASQINLRLTAAERRALHRAAKAAGQTVSEYLLSCGGVR